MRLSREILIYLVNKHDAYLPVTSSCQGNAIWRKIAEDYNRISDGLFQIKDAGQLNGKWRNILYHARKFGYPHPLEDDRIKNEGECDLIKQVEQLKEDPEMADVGAKRKPNIIKVLPCDRLEGIRGNIPPIDISCSDSPKNNKTSLPKPLKPLKSELELIKKQTALAALHYEQERYRLLLKTKAMEQDKLSIEMEVAELQLQQQKIKLSLCKNAAQSKGINCT